MLPPRAQKLFDRHLRADDDGLILNRSRAARIRELRTDLARAKQRREDLAEDGRDTAEADAEIERIQSNMAALQSEKSRVGLGSQLKQALEDHPLTKWKDCAPDLGKLGKADIAALDFDIDAAISERDAADAAPITAAEQKAAIQAQVSALAEAPRVVNGRVDWPMTYVSGQGVFSQKVINGGAILAFLFREQLLRSLESQIKDVPGALSRPARNTLLRKANAKILDLQRKRAALAEKFKVPHRSDADFRAILQIEAA